MLNGSVTRRNACHGRQPMSAAASSNVRSMRSSAAKMGSATNGTHTYTSVTITALRL